MDVLLGATGFVGGNLQRQLAFDRLFNSKNIEELAGSDCRRVICAAAPAAKWKANQEPAADQANLNRLMSVLQQIKAREFVLISTVDVFGEPLGVDEDSMVDPKKATPYGEHRFALEMLVRRRFNGLVVRLPGLFGQGLKKNVVYDFLNGNQVDKIHAGSAFQFYYLNRLAADIEAAQQAGLKLVHLATEPVEVRDVARVVLGRPFDNDPGTPPARYDFHTRHASHYGKTGRYIQDRDEVLADLAHYVADFRETRQCA